MKAKLLFRNLKLGLRMEVILNITILMVAALLLIGFTILKVSEQEILEQKIAGSRIIMFSLKRGIGDLERDEWYADPDLSKIVIGFSQLSEVEGIWIVDKDMKPLIVRGRGMKHGEDLNEAIAQGRDKIRVEKSGILWWSFYKRLILTAPLLKKGRVIGAMQVSFALEDVTERLVIFRRLVLILVLADSLVLIAFGSFLLARIVVNPLKRLVEITQRIRKGQLGQRAKVEYENEIGQLASSFNQMVERLEQKQMELKKTIKKLKETQKELVLSEKLASVGRLATGVAHEIGNPLTSILGLTDILWKKLKNDENLLNLVERMRGEMERINRIIKDLLQFSRPPSSHIMDIDVNLVIQESLNLITVQRNFIGINLELSLRDGLSSARGNSDQLQQILINILMNAADAMPSGGSIFVTTNEGGKWITISLRDTGEGIPADEIDKIFDPFFTNKPPDKGTGLGLSICAKIIEDFGGRIKVVSEKGKGAEFIIYLKKKGEKGQKKMRRELLKASSS